MAVIAILVIAFADERSGQVHIQHIVRPAIAVHTNAFSSSGQDRTSFSGICRALRMDRIALLRQVDYHYLLHENLSHDTTPN